MKIIISNQDADCGVVLDIAVNGEPWGELEPGKSVTVAGPQVTISASRPIEKEPQ